MTYSNVEQIEKIIPGKKAIYFDIHALGMLLEVISSSHDYQHLQETNSSHGYSAHASLLLRFDEPELELGLISRRRRV